MHKLALVPPGAPAPTPSTARQALSEHLGSIAAAQTQYDGLRATWSRMQAALDNEARCQSVLQTQIACEEEAMKAWARNPESKMPEADVFARQCNEEALANAKRAADVIRAALPEQSERSTSAVRELETLRGELGALVHAVLLEESAACRRELDATLALATEQAALLFGLRSYLDKQGAHSSAQEVPVNFELQPMPNAISKALEQWQDYAERVLRNPSATLEG